MAKLLRLHLTCVGHKDARFHPLTLDFRGRDGTATDNVVWLRNGGGKSSLLNLFYSTFLPESRKFLGSKAESKERRLADYVKAGDLACIVSEWEMPAGANLFSSTRIVGQALAWRGGVATSNDEERLDREFFTFRGSDKVAFESLPIHGLGGDPVRNLHGLREWLQEIAADHREIEVERGNDGKTKWRRKLDFVGLDTELFNYQLTMNVREGGAAELFKVRDTMEFVDLFLEMALHPQQAEKTADQIESVREKLRKLPLRELEERFILALLAELRPLAHEAVAVSQAEAALGEHRRQNELLRAAIEHSIKFRRSKALAVAGELTILEERISNANRERLAKQEYRLNYDSFFKQLRLEEARTERDRCHALLENAARRERVAEAAIRFADIRGRQAELDTLLGVQTELLAEKKPVLDELQSHGSAYAAALDEKLAVVEASLAGANDGLSRLKIDHEESDGRQKDALRGKATAENELKTINQRLVQRDGRRAKLREEGCVLPKEKAADAVPRWEEDEAQVQRDVEGAKNREEEIADETRRLVERESELALSRQKHEAEAAARDESWQRGDRMAASLRTSVPIRELMSSDAADLEFPELPALLRSRQSRFLDQIVQTRLDGEDDKRTLRSIETDQLFPPAREVEITVEHLRSRGVTTALPAYRFLAVNVPDAAEAGHLLARDPARFSGVVVTSESEFESIIADAPQIAGLRHPVAITLSELPSPDESPSKVAVALPGGAGAYHYGSAAAGQSEVDERIAKLHDRVGEIEDARQQTGECIGTLDAYRRDFGGGILSRHAAERDQARDEADRLGRHITGIQEQRGVLDREQADVRATLERLRGKLPNLAKTLERLRSYIEEYEGHESAWMDERENKQTALREFDRRINEETVALASLLAQMELARAAINDHTNERKFLRGERDEIAHLGAELPPGSFLLEAARTRYRTSLARFEERFGQNKLDGQIDEKRKQINELRASHDRESDRLTAEEIKAAAAFTDLASRRSAAREEHLAARSGLDDAKRLLQQAEGDLPTPRAHKQGLGLPPDVEPPTTAAEAATRRDEFDLKIAEIAESLAALGAQFEKKKSLKDTLESSVNSREPLLTTLEGLTDPAAGATPSLPDDDKDVANLVRQAKSTTETLARSRDAAMAAADDRVQALLKITRRDEFATLPPTARDRFVTMVPTELIERSAEFVQGYEARQAVLRDEIETLGKDKEIVVRQLDGIAATALRLLGQAERASTMPDAFPGWSGLPFLRITTQPLNEPAARRDRLAALVDRLANDKAIPRGSALASLAVRVVGGSIRATLLKPEDPLRPDRHDITEFSTFSGGEKMTAAILLYATLAQLRSRGRYDHGREREAGVLILDNPLGTASKRDFVELQLRVARQMGVQLIFTTGVNDLGALDVLPRILRLRKRHRDVRTGDLLLSQEPAEEHIEGVQANLRS
ncbi:MAG: hypothetical protein WA771_13305 [Chthoniobacterales bacterium]